MNNYKLILQYDGTRYNGWQKQQNTDMTIQGKLEAVLEKLEGKPVEVHGSGRTDAGVHAIGQVANVKLEWDGQPLFLRDYLNDYLPKDIAAVFVEQVPMRFHSRLNALGKTYCYRIRTSSVRSVFERNYVWQFGKELDVKKMRQAACRMLGEHDFLPFCDLKKMKKSSVRRIDKIEITEKEEEVLLSFTGNGFLYHMIRKITGTLAEIGTGEKRPEVIQEILQEKNRELAGGIAPAGGLVLKEVFY